MTGTPREPLVSIVTPSYNRADFIDVCIRSVQAQSYRNFEHIIIDGGSTDGTTEILAEAEREYSVRWVSEPDEGMYDAINKGLRMASGDIVCYLNTDDAYLPWSIESAVAALTAGVEMVFGDLLIIHQEPDGLRSYVQFYRPFNYRHYLWVQSIGQPTVFWTRSLLERLGGFDTDYRLIADCDYWMRAAGAGVALKKLDEVLAVQVDHGETLRESHAQLLKEEFRRLRTGHAPVAGVAGFLRLRAIERSARWRRDVWRLYFAFMSARPRRWPRFIGYLKQEGVQLRFAYALLSLLPGVWRSAAGHSMLDGGVFLRRLVGGSDD